jgi:3-dehydroquinate synthetase
VAAELSELSGFSETERIRRLLRRYELPVDAAVDRSEVFSVLAMDKKRDSNFMNYVLLNSIGEATVKKIPLDELEKLIIR